MPPQHGKSELVSLNFPLWYLGRNQRDRVLLGSYSAELANSWGAEVRDNVKEYGKTYFDIELNPSFGKAQEWKLTTGGGMHTAGSDGSFTGRRGDAVLIDDPHKSRKEAKSRVIQENIYEFYTDSADTRLSRKGIMTLIQTRWDLGDLAGRILKVEEHLTAQEAFNIFSRNEILDNDEWVILTLPALALEKETIQFGNDILWNRRVGEPLCPELHSKKKLLNKKKRTPRKRWVSLFDQKPILAEGDFFEEGWFRIREELPEEFRRILRWWDFASSKKKNAIKDSGQFARTAGVLIAATPKNDIWILDSQVLQEKPAKVRKAVVKWAILDDHRYRERFDQDIWIRGGKDPGQASADQELTYSKLLTGRNFKLVREVGSKEDRADNVAEHAEINGIYLLKGRWNQAFIQEHLEFPDGEWKDQVDATSGGFSQLLQGRIGQPRVGYVDLFSN